MITWNYRVFKETNGDYTIREVHYDENGSIVACTERAVEPFGESLAELAKDIEYFKEALTLPVLKMSDIPHSERQKSKRKNRKNLTREQLEAKLGIAKPRSARPSRRQLNNTKRVLVASSRKRR